MGMVKIKELRQKYGLEEKELDWSLGKQLAVILAIIALIIISGYKAI